MDDPDARPEIWAYGLRNPWRFSFDAETGDLWIADVGQSSREEINWVPAGSGGGQNFGWSRMEGTLTYDGDEPEGHVPPVFEYQTSDTRCSVTGGYVYRGSAIPELVGSYVFSDYCEGQIRALEIRDGEVVGHLDLGVNGGRVVAFAEDADQELYVRTPEASALNPPEPAPFNRHRGIPHGVQTFLPYPDSPPPRASSTRAGWASSRSRRCRCCGR